MHKVLGIYDHEKQHAMYEALRRRGKIYGVIYYLGMETGLRIGDILALRRPLVGGHHEVREGKTGKRKRFVLSDILVSMLHDYQQGLLHDPSNRLFPVSRQTVHKHFKAAAAELGLLSIGTHSTRKSYAWNVLTVTSSIQAVKRNLNHKYISTTMLYLVDGILWLIKQFYGPIFRGVYPSTEGGHSCKKTAPMRK